jgi:hypothetical protein
MGQTLWRSKKTLLKKSIANAADNSFSGQKLKHQRE